jgi:hypothetical protein
MTYSQRTINCRPQLDRPTSDQFVVAIRATRSVEQNGRILMKRIVIGLATGALGMLLLVPCANAQSWGDIQSDHAAVAIDHARIRRDRRELRWDLRHGDYAAAAHEQAEINRRRARIQARQADLYTDLVARNYGWHHHYRYSWHHYYDEDYE